MGTPPERPAASGSTDEQPLNIGTGVVCASFTPSGDWLSIGAPHQVHGFVELCAAPAFDERDRGDPVAVRRHRSDLADPANPILSVAVPAGLRHEVDTRAEPGACEIRQRHTFAGRGAGSVEIRVHDGRLDRPALAEITELEPPSPTGAVTRLIPGRRLELRADALPSTAWIEVRGRHGAELDGWIVDGSTASLLVNASEPSDLEVEISVGLDVATAPAPTRPSLPSVRESRRLVAPPRLHRGVERLAAANLAYVAGCTALRVGDGQRAILTDHRLLPLSWTRDAYYQALLLLASGGPGANAIVADHLRWLWLRCERPDGAWARSHHANGRPKDVAFQADQQLYPLLELTDYWRATGSTPGPPPGTSGWGRLVNDAWSVVEGVSHPETGLLASEENAADDPATLPYLLSAQLLAWYTAARLAEMAPTLRVEDEAWIRRAQQLRDAIGRWFVVDGAGGRQWAYAVDCAGSVDLHHDANDLPTALAPIWGFCRADDPLWLATMRFAFSSRNSAFFAGERPGLGSLHTPGPWSLGDIQAWIFASLALDRPAAEAALRRLLEVAFKDGLLPEAYSASGPLRGIRRWFAWPGAALAAFWLLDARGLLDARLAAR